MCHLDLLSMANSVTGPESPAQDLNGNNFDGWRYRPHILDPSWDEERHLVTRGTPNCSTGQRMRRTEYSVIDLLGIAAYIGVNKARHASQRCAPWRATLFLGTARA